ncbi:protein of unknown function [Taphrina deformans PYCC 5710]|uniref:PX domain-containing protein n=1 Tax=Taphrina deformans (strain PYCC 5710 / ATCC 11124 / CBS 356.35 / IMI 108563 / JCM 9778 / NBRC 8474) TaxID=1097556 RepID=R4XDH9_TAPDE|nr:protein of unknown function [Taphrina deformans PYCC 5710]|eukprot:CCG83895.1 protein of unknown function [Taphrina deformans PYCC 5710]
MIERYLRRVARHPALRCSDVVTSFLSDEDYQAQELSKLKPDCFFDLVIHPEWNHDDGDRVSVEEFSMRLESTMHDMHSMLASLRLLDISISQHATAMAKLANTLARASVNQASLLHDQPAGTDELLLGASKYFAIRQQSNMIQAGRYETSVALIDEWKHFLAGWTNLSKVHSVTTQKLTLLRDQTSEAALEIASRCDTILNVILAEMEVLRTQCTEDMMHLTEELLGAQSMLHKKCLVALESQTPLPLSLSYKRRMIKVIDDADANAHAQAPVESDPSYLSKVLQLVYPWT